MLTIKVHFFIKINIRNRILLYLGARPGSFQDFRIESHRVTPTPFSPSRQTQSPKGR
jgi:hypothetical protein